MSDKKSTHYFPISLKTLPPACVHLFLNCRSKKKTSSLAIQQSVFRTIYGSHIVTLVSPFDFFPNTHKNPLHTYRRGESQIILMAIKYKGRENLFALTPQILFTWLENLQHKHSSCKTDYRSTFNSKDLDKTSTIGGYIILWCLLMFWRLIRRPKIGLNTVPGIWTSTEQ